MNATPTSRAAIRAKALELGFDAVGFAKAELAPEAQENLKAFIAQGLHGEMDWMPAKADRRGDPQVLWPAAKSVVVLGLNYGPEEAPVDLPPDRANISVYARHRDYHDVLKKKLKALGRWIAETHQIEVKVFVDTAPVMEKPLAQAGGIGWQGKHTNLVSRDLGSWLFLGEVFLALDLPPDDAESDHCGECRRCLDACPTQAFPAPYRIDARRCISYLTIEHKGPIPHELRPLIGNRIYGCDVCLAVCPWNKFAQAAAQPALKARADLTAPDLAELATLDDAAFRLRFSGSPIKRIGRDRFLRNVLIAIGNSGMVALRGPALRSLSDPSPLVRGAAVWALGRLSSPAELRAMAPATPDPHPAVAEEWRIGLHHT
ncbi:tRNA epoxyqueuosine(34) reductase QueG [Dongia sedimenti]|uniref:Epoxyqueuosine reductase n=1 Tax=Dongia sedimenti TaxID=3064282 RepID=A0ABU0YLE9_9PROT|nr:tRNA epoxyqueuosine(34) reductase QueG [Rhodospirillaceae bacterium R-7]